MALALALRPSLFVLGTGLHTAGLVNTLLNAMYCKEDTTYWCDLTCYTGLSATATFTDAAEVSQCYSVNNQNYCYITSDSAPVSNTAARKLCMERNATLPVVTDEKIDSVFQRFINNDANNVIQNSPVWLDAHARHVDNSVNWHWINGQPSGIV